MLRTLAIAATKLKAVRMIATRLPLHPWHILKHLQSECLVFNRYLHQRNQRQRPQNHLKVNCCLTSRHSIVDVVFERFVFCCRRHTFSTGTSDSQTPRQDLPASPGDGQGIQAGLAKSDCHWRCLCHNSLATVFCNELCHVCFFCHSTIMYHTV